MSQIVEKLIIFLIIWTILNLGKNLFDDPPLALFWEKNLNLWDVASGVLLVKEAGGKVTDTNGEEWSMKSTNILASNLIIHSKLKENLSQKIFLMLERL